MDCMEALKTRRSVRSYTGAPVLRAAIEDIVDCGRLAATANNLQPWEFVVVTDPNRLREIADLTDWGKFIPQAGACIVVFCKETKYYLEDGSNASQNMLVAAHAHGLGTCWVAGDKKHYADPIRRLLGAPESFKLISLIALGHTAEQTQKAKRPLAEVLHWDKF